MAKVEGKSKADLVCELRGSSLEGIAVTAMGIRGSWVLSGPQHVKVCFIPRFHWTWSMIFSLLWTRLLSHHYPSPGLNCIFNCLTLGPAKAWIVADRGNFCSAERGTQQALARSQLSLMLYRVPLGTLSRASLQTPSTCAGSWGHATEKASWPVPVAHLSGYPGWLRLPADILPRLL